MEDVSRITASLIRIVNKYKKLDSKALDFGTGDFLFPSEIHVIEAIGKKQGNTVNEICQKFGVTKGAISQILNKLSEKGLIEKKRNPDFYKEKMLSLTAKGRKAFMGHEKLHKLMDEDLCRNMMNFKNDDLKNFEVILQVIESQIEKYTELGKK